MRPKLAKTANAVFEKGAIDLLSRALADGLRVDIFVDAIDAGFELFHKERNHWGCLGWTCVEFSFISQEAKRDIFAHDMCPGILKLSERWS